MTLYYYYLCDEKNNEKFNTLMNALEIDCYKSTITLFSKTYVFISIDKNKQDYFTKLLIAGIFFNFLIYPFSDISI